MRFIVVFYILIFLCSNSYAFQDNENTYNQIYKQSTIFRLAEKELSKVWKEIYEPMPTSSKKTKLLEDQRNWIKDGRGVLVENYIHKGCDINVAYTQATFDRIRYLKEKYGNQSQNQKNDTPIMHSQNDELAINDKDQIQKNKSQEKTQYKQRQNEYSPLDCVWDCYKLDMNFNQISIIAKNKDDEKIWNKKLEICNRLKASNNIGTYEQFQMCLATGRKATEMINNARSPIYFTEDPNSIKLLLDAGANVNECRVGNTCLGLLMTASDIAEDKRATIAKLYLSYGADPNEMIDNNALLSYAKSKEVAEILINSGANINACTKNSSLGVVPCLMYFALKLNEESDYAQQIIDVLIKKGATIDDNFWKTIVSYKDKNTSKAIEYLASRGYKPYFNMLDQFSDNDLIQKVKDTWLREYPEVQGYKNIGTSFDAFFGNPRWSVIEKINGTAKVYFSGIGYIGENKCHFEAIFNIWTKEEGDGINLNLQLSANKVVLSGGLYRNFLTTIMVKSLE